MIQDCLIRFSLPISQCRGQAYDGAANMSGYISGVAARIQRIEQSAIFVHCLVHSNNLCLKSLSRISVCVHESLHLVMGLGQLIRFSPKQCTLFEAFQAEMTPGAPTLKPLCPTRWTVRTKAIDSVLRNYSVLLNELKIVQQSKDEYAMKAHGYLDTMGKFKAFFGLKLSFSATEQLSHTLQGKDTSLQQAVAAFQLAVSFLERQRTEEAFSSFYKSVLFESHNLTEKPVLPHQRESTMLQLPHSFSNPESLLPTVLF